MLRRLATFLLLLSSGALFSSCSTTKPLLTQIPAVDLTRNIYFFDGGLKSTTVADSESTELYSGGFDLTFFPIGKSAPFESSVSRSGNYLATHHDKIRLADLKLSERLVDVGIFDLRKKDFVSDFRLKVQFPEFKSDNYQIQWSAKDSGFFYIESDSIRKAYPGGGYTTLFFHENLRSCSVSPSEERILFFHDDSVELFDVRDRSTRMITASVGSRKNVRAVSWTPDESFVCFAAGWHIYIYDIPGRAVTQTGADGTVLWTEWLPDRSLVFTEGHFPADMQLINTPESFRICKYIPSSGDKTVIHERLNASPFYVRPRLSPSGTLLLFSEQRLNGGDQVKLMSLDGQRMKTICDGSDPLWGR
jgi:WD40 repeat protein